MYNKSEFFFINPADVEEKYIPYYEECFKVVINDEKVTSKITEKVYNLSKFDTYIYVMDLIKKDKVNHIYEYVNMFFMFKEQYDVIEHRYLMRDRFGNITENTIQMCDRVATFISLAEPQDRMNAFEKMSKWYPVFLKKLLNMEISPNTPTWVSAGIPGFGSFACVVVDNGDDLGDLAKWYKDTMFLNKNNFGIGHSLHKIRPKNSPFGKSKIKTKSSINWLFPIQDLAETMSQGNSGRDGANMVSMPIWHPDIVDFIPFKMKAVSANGKSENARDVMKIVMNSDIDPVKKEKIIDLVDKSIPLKSFNTSVLVNDKFMQAVKDDGDWEIHFQLPDHEYREKVTKKARELFDLICKSAWECADPGLLFYDRMNKDNVIKKVKNSLYTTNPCGEIPLHPYSVCNLWTINLVKHFDFYHRKLTLGKLRDTINVTVRAGDNLTTVNQYPKEIPEIERNAKAERRIGIDFTGLADYIYLCRLNYGSQESNDEINSLYKLLRDTARSYSAILGKKKGDFPLYRKSAYKISQEDFDEIKSSSKCPECGKKVEKHDNFVQCSSCNWVKFLHIRNMHLLTQAPTGTRSRKLGVSFGIEPHYYKWWVSNIMEGKQVYNVNRVLEWYLKQFSSRDDVDDQYKGYDNLRKTIENGDYPIDVLGNWVESHDLKPYQHLKVQAIAQRWIDQAVSKTINLPKNSTPSDIGELYMMAWEMGLKGITVYREGSHFREVIGKKEKCPECDSDNLLKIEGCVQCKDCAWSKCLI
jgi:ribonucleoside-diphosphate reductase alpha chain